MIDISDYSLVVGNSGDSDNFSICSSIGNVKGTFIGIPNWPGETEPITMTERFQDGVHLWTPTRQVSIKSKDTALLNALTAGLPDD